MSRKSHPVRVAIDTLTDMVVRVLQGKGFSRLEASIITNCLMWAEKRCNPQGVIKLLDIKHSASVEAMDIQRIKTHVRVNANGVHAMVALQSAVTVGLDALENESSVTVAVTGTDQSSGAVGYFTEQAALAGKIAILFGSTPRLVAPYGGSERIMGTNPISIAIPTALHGEPTDCPPFVLDTTIAETSWYAVIQASKLGVRLTTAGLDKDGDVTLDPNKILDGGMLTAKGVIGSGLGIANQIIASMLTGSNSDWGHFLIILNPAFIDPSGNMWLRISPYLEQILDTRPAGGHRRVYYPGLGGRELSQSHQADGFVELDDTLYQRIVELAEIQE